MPERPRNTVHYGRFGELIRDKLRRSGCTCELGIEIKPNRARLAYDVHCLRCNRVILLSYLEALHILDEAQHRRVFPVKPTAFPELILPKSFGSIDERRSAPDDVAVESGGAPADVAVPAPPTPAEDGDSA